MASAISEIEERVRALSAEDKAELIRTLIADLDGPLDADVERAWLAEAERRNLELAEGKVRPVPREQVFETLRSRLKP